MMLTLRQVKESDRELLWEWANDPLVRSQAFSAAHIEWNDHVAWFEKKLADDNCFQFIAMRENQEPIGQVRFDVKDQEAEIHVSVSAKVRSQGYGVDVILAGIQEGVKEFSCQIVFALVKPDNDVSLKVFEKAGFDRVAEVVYKGQGAVRLEFELS